MKTIAVSSRGMMRMPNLQTFLHAEVRRAGRAAGACDMIAGWGGKPSGLRAREAAKRAGVPCLLVEDGFLRSIDRDGPPLSLVADDVGIYHDATRASRLETLIASPLTATELSRARALIDAWKAARVSKYNHARDYEGDLPESYVLVVDQTQGDASVRDGLADATTFARMLTAAIDENPGRTVIVKCHPDVFTRKKLGFFDPRVLAGDARVRVIATDCHAARLIEGAEAVYTVTSQMGFEALLYGKRTRTFGMPFYAGWGLTQDQLLAPARRASATLEQLAHAALIRYPRYVDPETGEPCDVERVLGYLAFQRQMRARFPAHLHASGISWLKRPVLRRFLAGSTVHFSRAVPRAAHVALWGRAQPKQNFSGRTIRIEDGFLRSVGLGADLVQPVSWVLDEEGIYYDASAPSALERILQETDFDPVLVKRAQRLRERIVGANLTKYNSATTRWTRPDTVKPVILVPGQVEHDAAIRFATPGVHTNIGLLQAVRKNRPDAHVIYKPHPDVVAGLRRSGRDENGAKAWCDEIVTDACIASMLAEVDEVHTLASLSGFEALLRGSRVTCYGQPFYAGWGLTSDHHPVARRTRNLRLDELVVGALILYPTYVSRVTGCFTTPERAVEELISWRERRRELPAWRRVLRPLWLLGDSWRRRMIGFPDVDSPGAVGK
jgi:capsular polysaccharide export protein